MYRVTTCRIIQFNRDIECLAESAKRFTFDLRQLLGACNQTRAGQWAGELGYGRGER